MFKEKTMKSLPLDRTLGVSVYQSLVNPPKPASPGLLVLQVLYLGVQPHLTDLTGVSKVRRRGCPSVPVVAGDDGVYPAGGFPHVSVDSRSPVLTTADPTRHDTNLYVGVQYSTVQYSTVQYSTVQYCTCM